MRNKRAIKLDYSVLQPMDLVLTGGYSPLAILIKWKTAGRKNMLNPDIATHCGVVVEWKGQLLIAEMLGRGLSLNSLEEYTGRRRSRWIVGIRRHFVYNNAIIRENAQRRIALDLRYTLDYDHKGIISFVSDRVKQDKKKNYCSEYAYMQTAADEIRYPDDFAFKVSPRDLQIVENGYIDLKNYKL